MKLVVAGVTFEFGFVLCDFSVPKIQEIGDDFRRKQSLNVMCVIANTNTQKGVLF
jgi:hypothetical protein